MPVTIACPSCGVKLNVPDNFLGKKVRCASCSTVFEAKAAPPAPAADEVEADPAEEYIKPQAPAPLPEAPLDEPDERDDYDDRDGREDRESRRRRRRRRDMEPHRGGWCWAWASRAPRWASLAARGFAAASSSTCWRWAAWPRALLGG